MPDSNLVQRFGGDFSTPYHFSDIRGSRAELLIDLPFEGLSARVPTRIIPGHPSRRAALKVGAVVAGGILGVGLRPTRARADFGASFFVGAFLTAGIIWLTNRLLNTAFPPNADLGLRQVPNPRPAGNTFNDRFAEPYEVTNKAYWSEARVLPGYRVSFGLREHLLLKDLNGVELHDLERAERYYDGPLLPSDLRRPYNETFQGGSLRRVNHSYGVNITPEDVNYQQTFRDKQRREHRGFGVILRGNGGGERATSFSTEVQTYAPTLARPPRI